MASKKYTKSRKRPPIAVQREVKVEANHSCIVCEERVSLQLHHINGNREDNRLENIAYICGNCHGMAHDGKISAMDLRKYKKRSRQTDKALLKFQKSISYFLGSPEIAISEDFLSMKLRYHEKLTVFADKLIFYQCFIFLVPEFYIDQRGESVRAIVREILKITPEEERSILAELERMKSIEVTGNLIYLKNNSDAKIALNELVDSGKIDIQMLIEKFIEI